MKVNGRSQEVLEQESLLILSIKDAKNEDTSIESFRVLLKYGADMDLGVRRYDENGKEYLYYPTDVFARGYFVSPMIMQRKRKIWDDRKKVLKKF
ncbi:hypothetical protein [Leptospira interrogans]|uniref:hypothetical protein n=1 Tax=Leptospira interrogans TaxID=173 RepID=UPI0004A369FF|nr:hypothetical protein [Leptospira interrogans]